MRGWIGIIDIEPTTKLPAWEPNAQLTLFMSSLNPSSMRRNISNHAIVCAFMPDREETHQGTIKMM